MTDPPANTRREADPAPAAPAARFGWVTVPLASVIGAILVFVGGVIGAVLGGYFDLSRTGLESERQRILADIENAGDRELEKLKNDGLINIEKFKLQRDLILKAIESPTPKGVRDTLKLFAETGLIADFKDGVLTYLANTPDDRIPFDGTLGNLKKDEYRGKVDRYRYLLDLIGRSESLGNYNAYFNGVSNTSEPRFTEMTIADVRRWQENHVRNGSPSSAVGKYLMIRKTIDALTAELGITGSELFSPEHQDILAVKLLEKRGIEGYVNGNVDRNEFAVNLAREWATIPLVVDIVVNGRPLTAGQSYYHGDNLNVARIAPEELLRALDSLVRR